MRPWLTTNTSCGYAIYSSTGKYDNGNVNDLISPRFHLFLPESYFVSVLRRSWKCTNSLHSVVIVDSSLRGGSPKPVVSSQAQIDSLKSAVLPKARLFDATFKVAELKEDLLNRYSRQFFRG